MRKKGLVEAAYKQLTPKERFIAVLEAISRLDEDEVDRLGRSCPRETYKIADPAYTDLLDQSRLVADCFAILWLSAAQDYRLSVYAGECYISGVSGWVKGYAQGANSAWERAGHNDALFDVDGREPSDDELDEIGLSAAVDGFPEKYEKYHRGLASVVKGTYEGFTRFCETVGLEPKKLLAWYPPILDDIEDLRGLLENDEIDPDEELATRLFEALLSSWPVARGRSHERPLREDQPQHAAMAQ